MEAREIISGVGAAPPDLPGPHRYLPYYGLETAPFRAGADPRLLWLGPAHRALLDDLGRAVRDRDGIVLLTGDVGTGKTCLANRLGHDLAEAGLVVGRMHHPGADPADFFQTALGAFGVGRDIQTREEFLAAFQRLLDRPGPSRKLLLVIDEAQTLTHPLLQEVRELSELSLSTRSPLSILLVGHPELSARLLEERNTGVRRRIAAEYTLGPLRREEVGSYITHVLEMAGASREVFGDQAVEAIASLSRGAPGAINIICDRALLLGEARRVRPISRAIVQECCTRPGSPGPVRGKAGREGRPARLLHGRSTVSRFLRRVPSKLGLGAAVLATIVVVIGAQSMSPSTWLAGLRRPSAPPSSAPGPGREAASGAGGKAAIAITEAPRVKPAAPVAEMSPVVPAVLPPTAIPDTRPTVGAGQTGTEPAEASPTLPSRLRPSLPPPAREAAAPRDPVARPERPAISARRVEPRSPDVGRPSLAPTEQAPRRPSPAPTSPVRDDRDAPDPGAIIDWVFKGATTGSH